MSVRSSIPVLLWGALVGCIVAAVAYLLVDWAMPAHVSIEPAVGGEIVVDVRGAVATPGVVRLPAGARLQSAITAAGGLTPDADVSGLDLAARLGDGEQTSIPDRAAQATPEPDGEPVQPDGPSGSLINVNTAGLSELDQLPGVGPTIAQRIIDYRERNGPFQSIDALAEIEGISGDMVEELRPLVTIGG